MGENEPGRILDFRNESRDTLARAREALAPVHAALEAAGFYAYGTVDTEHRWVISADDEAGHVGGEG